MHVDGVFPLTFVLHQIGSCESLQGLVLEQVLHPFRGAAESPQALEGVFSQSAFLRAPGGKDIEPRQGTSNDVLTWSE